MKVTEAGILFEGNTDVARAQGRSWAAMRASGKFSEGTVREQMAALLLVNLIYMDRLGAAMEYNKPDSPLKTLDWFVAGWTESFLNQSRAERMLREQFDAVIEYAATLDEYTESATKTFKMALMEKKNEQDASATTEN